MLWAGVHGAPAVPGVSSSMPQVGEFAFDGPAALYQAIDELAPPI